MALIIALLSTMARNRTFSPCGPWRIGTVMNGLLVLVRTGLPESSTEYTSVMVVFSIEEGTTGDVSTLQIWAVSVTFASFKLEAEGSTGASGNSGE